MPSNADTIFIRNVLNSWKQVIAQTDKTLALHSDAELQREVGPGRNRLYYLLGHLTAVNDRLYDTLRLGSRLHPELDEEFLDKPDKTFPESRVSASDLRKAWSEVNGRLIVAMEKLRPDEWLERHNSVSPEDFAKEPLRNRLAVLISRMNHTASHEGQMRLGAREGARLRAGVLQSLLLLFRSRAGKPSCEPHKDRDRQHDENQQLEHHDREQPDGDQDQHGDAHDRHGQQRAEGEQAEKC